jgi:hypothetical protein
MFKLFKRVVKEDFRFHALGYRHQMFAGRVSFVEKNSPEAMDQPPMNTALYWLISTPKERHKPIYL